MSRLKRLSIPREIIPRYIVILSAMRINFTLDPVFNSVENEDEKILMATSG